MAKINEPLYVKLQKQFRPVVFQLAFLMNQLILSKSFQGIACVAVFFFFFFAPTSMKSSISAIHFIPMGEKRQQATIFTASIKSFDPVSFQVKRSGDCLTRNATIKIDILMTLMMLGEIPAVVDLCMKKGKDILSQLCNL